MKKIIMIAMLATTMLATSCKNRQPAGDKSAIDVSMKLPGDQMIYGLACDGCSDSVVVFLPNEGGDPVTYNIVGAMRKKQVFGHPEIGDWVALMINPENKREATMVIDLDQLKGTWTYQVFPTLKESAVRSERQIQSELTDSMRARLFIPREYGFTLKRQHQAASVGAVYKGNSLSDESLVEYPPVKRYTEWNTFNGKLLLRRDTLDAHRQRIPDNKVKSDTAEFIFMLEDTLALRINGEIIGFHRQKNAREANKKASEAARQQAKNDSIR